METELEFLKRIAVAPLWETIDAYNKVYDGSGYELMGYRHSDTAVFGLINGEQMKFKDTLGLKNHLVAELLEGIYETGGFEN